jgi:hypothetical protein
MSALRRTEEGLVVGFPAELTRHGGVFLTLIGLAALVLCFYEHNPLHRAAATLVALLGLLGGPYTIYFARWREIISFDTRQQVVRSKGRTVIFKAVDCLRVRPYMADTYQLDVVLRDGSKIFVLRVPYTDQALHNLARAISEETGIPIG